MSISFASVVSRVKTRIAMGADPRLKARLDFDISQATVDALKQLGHEAASGNHTSIDLFTTDFSLTVTSGVGSIAAFKVATEPLIAEYMHRYELTDATGTFQWVPDKTTLSYDLRNLYRYWTLNGNSVLIRNTNGSLTSYTGTVTISGSFIPQLSSVPPELEDRLIDLAVGVLQNKPDAPAA